jgi:hypothetical protein
MLNEVLRGIPMDEPGCPELLETEPIAECDVLPLVTML